MTTAIEHLRVALDNIEQAREKLSDSMGTRMMLSNIEDDLRGLINRYERINDDSDE